MLKKFEAFGYPENSPKIEKKHVFLAIFTVKKWIHRLYYNKNKNKNKNNNNNKNTNCDFKLALTS